MQLQHFHRVDVQGALPALLDNLESTARFLRSDHAYHVQHVLLNITSTMYATVFMILFVKHADYVITWSGHTTQLAAQAELYMGIVNHAGFVPMDSITRHVVELPQVCA